MKRKEAGLMENLRKWFSYRSGLRESVCEKEQCQCGSDGDHLMFS